MKTSKLLEARENASDQITRGLSFESDWLKRWRELTVFNFLKDKFVTYVAKEI